MAEENTTQKCKKPTFPQKYKIKPNFLLCMYPEIFDMVT